MKKIEFEVYLKETMKDVHDKFLEFVECGEGNYDYSTPLLLLATGYSAEPGKTYYSISSLAKIDCEPEENEWVINICKSFEKENKS